MSTTSSKISQFISRTGSSNKVAQELLKENQWNVDCAVNVYKLMNEVSTMPKKNNNTKQNLMDIQSATSRHLSHDFRATNKIKPTAQDFYKNSSESLTASYRNDTNSNNRGKQQQRIPDLQTRHSETTQESRNLPSDDVCDSTFILPDFSTYPDDFRNFLDKDLIETSTLDLLMKTGRLNWWSDLGCQPLFPLVTTGDGNCLLHAASLALWGHQDTDLTLRRRLFEMLNGIPHHDSFYRRWKWHQMQINKQSELVYSHLEWLEEWNSLIKLASPQPRISLCNLETSQGLNQVPSLHQGEPTNGSSHHQYDQQEIQYESLEELHIFVLAHLLKRPIIITADTILRDSGGEALAPITFGGVYLPLEHPPAACHRFPILLTYDAAHFSALVPTEDSFQSSLIISRGSDGGREFSGSVPLVDFNLNLLPVHFVRDPGPNYNWNEEKMEAGRTEENREEPIDSVDNGEKAMNGDEVTLVEKVAALKKYLEIEVASVSHLANSFSSLDSGEAVRIHDNSLEKLNGHVSTVDGSVENSDSRRVSETSRKERTSSDASDPSNAHSSAEKNMAHVISNDLFNGEKSKREKSRGLGKLKKIAKSVSANFKRSFNVKNSVKHTPSKSIEANSRDKHTPCHKNIKSESPAGSPEPSNVVQFIVESLEKKTRIPCARLLYKRQDYQTEIIRNYLEQASERFLLTRKRELERMQAHLPPPPHHPHHPPPDKSFEIFHRPSQQQQTSVIKHTPSHASSATLKTSPVQCINTGCNGRATSDTSYLCADCYEKQKSEEAKIKNTSNNNNISCSGNNNSDDGTTVVADETSDRRPSKINNCIRSRVVQDSPLKPSSTSRKNIASSSVLKSSVSDDFRANSSTRIILEKYTKVDNRMLVATETTEADFHGDGQESETDTDVVARCKDPSGADRSGLNVHSLSRNLSGVDGFERLNKSSVKVGKCPTEGCPFYGSQLTDQYCSSCFKKRNVC